MYKDSWEYRSYEWFKGFRDVFLKPICYVLTKFGVGPGLVTYGSLVLMVFYIMFVRQNLPLSLLFVVLVVVSDGVDGALARYQKKASDKGKFEDVVVDYINYMLFVVGLVYGQLVDPALALVFVCVLLLSSIFRIIIHSFDFKSSWLFYPSAGLLPHFAGKFLYLLFLVFVVWGENFFFGSFVTLSVLLLVDAVYHFFMVLQKSK